MRKTRVLALCIISGFSAITLATSTIAWFAIGTHISFGTDTNDVNVTGGSVASYYESGSGAIDDKYVISDKIHLYNLAWLQYIGYYNAYKTSFQENAPNDIVQCYFELKNDIDMDGLTLPPIGTEKYPFLGNFDGRGYTISNFTISNDNPVPDSSDFGVAKPANFYAGEQSNIVGFFGVVGNLPNQTISYDSSIVGFYNTTLSNFTVKAKTSQVLIGLAGGYVNGDMHNVKINGNATIDINGQSVSALGGDFQKVSDYGLVGYTDRLSSNTTFSQKLSEYYHEGGSTAPIDDDWGGSFNSKDYTTWIYSVNHSSTSTTTDSVSGQGGYVLSKSSSVTSNPANNQVIYRLRDGSYLPLKFSDSTKSKAALSNTGYLVGSNVGTGVNASPKISSYYLRNIVNSIYDTTNYTRMDYVYNNKGNNGSGTMPTITYDDSKLEILTYTETKVNNKNWIRIKDSHNSSHNTVNPGLSGYTKSDNTTPESLGFEKYNDSREALQHILTDNNFVHGIHFDNNQVSSSNLLTIPANTARVGGVNYTTSYQVPKGSINFNLKSTGFINFFAGTYNSGNVSLNFFSLNHVFRSGGTITNIKPISAIYQNNDWNNQIASSSSTNPKFVYKYSDNTYSSGTAGSLVFNVATILGGNAPVNNAVYYFEVPVNDGEYAMGVSGSTQGAYMLYLDIGANGDSISQDEVSAYSITTKRGGNNYPTGVDFAPITVTGNGGDTFGVSIASGKQGTITFAISSKSVAITQSSSILEYAFRNSANFVESNPSDNKFTISGLTGDPPSLAAGGERILTISLKLVEGSEYLIKIVDELAADEVSFTESNSVYTVEQIVNGEGQGETTSSMSEINDLLEETTCNVNSSVADEDSLRNLVTPVLLERKAGYVTEFVTTYDVENCSYDDQIIDVDIVDNGAYLDIEISDSDFTLIIGTTEYVDGDEYPSA